jgi:hypothetical protein
VLIGAVRNKFNALCAERIFFYRHARLRVGDPIVVVGSAVENCKALSASERWHLITKMHANCVFARCVARNGSRTTKENIALENVPIRILVKTSVKSDVPSVEKNSCVPKVGQNGSICFVLLDAHANFSVVPTTPNGSRIGRNSRV